jgi:hypothetical protein
MTRSPRRLREQVKDTVSELPIHAARLAVMGVGRALLLTDRVRKDYREARESGLGPVLGRLKDDAGALTGSIVGKVAGNGEAAPESRVAADSEISVGKPPATRPATPPKPAGPAEATRPKPAPKAAAKPKPAPKPKAETKAETKTPVAKKAAAGASLPITGYDEATLASVRARLRGLDARQVAELRDYERANAARADFLRMYENRIAKLRGER